MKTIKQLLNKKITTKHKGQSDLIASLFAILAMCLFVLFFIYAIRDVDTKIQMDQVVRQYILRMESSGELTDEDEKELIADLMEINAVAKAVEKGHEIKVTWNNNQGAKGYGSTITLEVECPAVTTSLNNDEGLIGTLSEDNVQIFTIKKQSTAKY